MAMTDWVEGEIVSRTGHSWAIGVGGKRAVLANDSVFPREQIGYLTIGLPVWIKFHQATGRPLSGEIVNFKRWKRIVQNPEKLADRKLARNLVHFFQSKLRNIKQPDGRSDFTIIFDPSLTEDQIRTSFKALSDFYRVCGGVGFSVEFAHRKAPVMELAYD